MGDLHDLTDSEFERADLSGTRFSSVNLNGARILHSQLHRVMMRGVEISDTTIDGEIQNLVINGVDVAPLGKRTAPLVGPGRPDEGETFPVRECLLIVLNEEWQHRLYAERDLAVLQERS